MESEGSRLVKGMEAELKGFLKECGSYPESETQRKETENAKVQSKETLRRADNLPSH